MLRDRSDCCLKRRLQLLYDLQNQPKPGEVAGPGLPGVGAMDPEVPPEMTSVGATPAAAQRLRELALEQFKMVEVSDTDPMLEAWVRFSDMVTRLALIHAVGRYSDRDLHGITVDLSDVIFAERPLTLLLRSVQGTSFQPVANPHDDNEDDDE